MILVPGALDQYEKAVLQFLVKGGRPKPNNVKAFASAFVNHGGDLEDLANFDDPVEEGVCSIIQLGSFEILKKYVCSRLGACLPSKQ